MKKISLDAVLLFVLVVMLFVGFTVFGGNNYHPAVHAQTSDCKNGATSCLIGWAWSSNIGWVSFNSDNAGAGGGSYEVDVDDAGNLRGYAWSSNIGWISFDRNETANPPSVGTPDIGSGSGPIAKFDKNTGAVTGWARALAGCAGDVTTWNGTRCLVTGAGKDNGIGGGSVLVSTTSTTVTSSSTWTKQISSGSHYWIDVAGSDDGTKLVAADIGACCYAGGYIYTSTDSGVTWIKQISAGSRVWASVTSSADGTKLAAIDTAPGYIYTSTDSGATWTQRTGPGAKSWMRIASSADGQKLITAQFGPLTTVGYIYTSSDGGVNWTARTVAGARDWMNVAVSADGMTMVATEVNNNTSGHIYVSRDAGVNWSTNVNSGACWNLTISEDGNKIAAVCGAYLASMYFSTDAGLTWVTRNLGTYIFPVKYFGSGGGLILANFFGATFSFVVGQTNTFLVSTDDAVTSKSIPTPQNLAGVVSISASGEKIVFADRSPGYIYTYGPSGSNVVVTTSTSTSNGGWDGWIELSGTNHNSPNQTGNGGVTYNNGNSIFNGFAWGSDVVGWLQFSPSLRSSTKCTGSECGIVNQAINGTCVASPASSDATTDVNYTISVATGTPPYYFNNLTSSSTSPYVIKLNENSSHVFDVPVTDSNGVPGTVTCSFDYTGTPVGPNSCVLPAHATTTDPTNCTFTCLAPYKINTAKTACVKPGIVIEQ